MNRIKLRSFAMLLISCVCMISIPVWAAETADGSLGEAYVSPVVTAGSGTTGKAAKTAPVTEDAPDTAASRGILLGTFTTTGYCNCEQCSGGFSLTYSGCVPRAGHTISADLDIFPIGTELMIDGVVYTVEDIGSSINGQKLDIYYASHEEALAHGLKTQEVFTVTD